MKKHIGLIITVCLATILFAQVFLQHADLISFAMEDNGSADEYEYISGNYKYKKLENNEIEITGWAGESTRIDIDVPETIDGMPVVSIGESAFSGKEIASIKLPYGLREIKDYAFGGMLMIGLLEIPETVLTVGNIGLGHHGIPCVAISENTSITNNEYMESTLVKYHTEEGKAVISDISMKYNSRFCIPETICGNPVVRVEKLTVDSSFDSLKAIFVKEDIEFTDEHNRILVRYAVDGEACRVTGVTGELPNGIFELYNDINGRRIKEISGVSAKLNAIAVPEELAGTIDVDCAVLSCKKRGYEITVTEVKMNETQSLEISSLFESVILTEEQSKNITTGEYVSKLVYRENQDGVEICDMYVYSSGSLFIPQEIKGRSVTGITDNCRQDFFTEGDNSYIYVPSSVNSENLTAYIKYVYIENSDSVSVTGFLASGWNEGGTALEDIFGKPIDTYVAENGLGIGLDINRDKNLIKYQNNGNGGFEVTEIKQGENTSTVVVPGKIGNTEVNKISDDAISENVTCIVVPESVSTDNIPENVAQVKYTEDDNGSFTITETIGENINVKFAESVDGKSVSTIIMKEELKEKVEVPEKADKIAYKEEENGNITITEIKKGDGKETVEVPVKIGEKPVEMVLVREDTDVRLPETVSQITYREDDSGNVIITEVVPAKDINGETKPLEMPESIGNKVPSVEDSVQEKMQNIPHTHKLVRHGAFASSCTVNGMEEYWHCSACGKIFKDENGAHELDGLPQIPLTAHTYSAEWLSDEVSHWHECTACGNRTDVMAHFEVSENVEDNVKTYRCMICGKTRTEMLPQTEDTTEETTDNDNSTKADPTEAQIENADKDDKTDTAPKMGDNSQLLFCSMLMILSFAGLYTVIMFYRKRF